MRKIIILGSIAAGVSIASFLAIKTYYPWMSKTRSLNPPISNRFLCNFLLLSNPQREKIEEMDTRFSLKTTRLRVDLGKKRHELARLLLQPKLDRKQIDRKLEEIAALQLSLQKEVINHLFALKGVLAAEQRTKFFTMIAEELCFGEGANGKNHNYPPGVKKKGRFELK
ncbi:MAG: periplasmic heavy metal sensor [bacterium]